MHKKLLVLSITILLAMSFLTIFPSVGALPPFSLETELTDATDVINSVFTDNDYIYAGGRDDKVQVYYNGNLTLKTELTNAGDDINSIHADNDYVYTAGQDTKLQVYYKSNLTLKTELTDANDSINSVYADNDYIYAGGDDCKVQIYYKSNLTLKTELTNAGNGVSSIFTDNDYIYAGGYDKKIQVYYKNNLTLKTELTNAGDDINSVFVDNNYTYTGGYDCKVQVYYKSNFTLKTELTNATDVINSVFTDNDYIYAGGRDDKVQVYYKSNFTLKTELIDASNTITSIHADNDYIYAGGYDSNIQVYNKFYHVHKPNKPICVSPNDNQTNVSSSTTLKVSILDIDGDNMKINFYYSNDTLIQSFDNQLSSSCVETNPLSLNYNTTYSWYTIANDSEFESISDIFSFTTKENDAPNKPTIYIKPDIRINEDFNGSWLPTDWEEIVYSGDGHWEKVNDESFNYGIAYRPPNSILPYASASSSEHPTQIFNVSIFTPKFNINSISDSVYLDCGISFYADTSGGGYIRVWSENKTTLEETLNEYNFSYEGQGNFHVEDKLDTNNYTSLSNIQIEFYYTTNEDVNQYFFSIDNVKVYILPTTNIPITTTLKVHVIDIDNDTMIIRFYWDDDILIETITNVQNDTDVETSNLLLEYNTTYSWYAIADDSLLIAQSDTFIFTTGENAIPSFRHIIPRLEPDGHLYMIYRNGNINVSNLNILMGNYSPFTVWKYNYTSLDWDSNNFTIDSNDYIRVFIDEVNLPYNDTLIPITPQIRFKVNDVENDKLNITVTSNSSGEWITVKEWINVSVGWFSCRDDNMNNYNTTYYYNINVTDSYGNNNNCGYLMLSFTTTSTEPAIPPFISANDIYITISILFLVGIGGSLYLLTKKKRKRFK